MRRSTFQADFAVTVLLPAQPLLRLDLGAMTNQSVYMLRMQECLSLIKGQYEVMFFPKRFVESLTHSWKCGCEQRGGPNIQLIFSEHNIYLKSSHAGWLLLHAVVFGSILLIGYVLTCLHLIPLYDVYIRYTFEKAALMLPE